MIAVSGLFVAVSWGVFYYPYWLFVVLTMAVFWLPEFCLLESWPRISLLPRRSLSGAVGPMSALRQSRPQTGPEADGSELRE
jgi:hypothetical protein